MRRRSSRARLPAAAIAAVLALPCLAAPPREPLHVQASRAVFRLEHLDKDATEHAPDGTAFVIRWRDELYLVTARHVAEMPYDLRARVPSRRADNGETEVVELRIPRDAWVFHELGPRVSLDEGKLTKMRAVDVAVARLYPVEDRTIVAFLWCDPCSEGEADQLPDIDPVPPADVLIVGFPGDLGFTLREQRPMFRQGIVALVAGERFLTIEGGFVDERSFILDAKIEPGNSGSPVLHIDPVSGAITVVGLVSAANFRADFGIAEPASRIRETLARARANPPASRPDWYLLRSGPPHQSE